MSKIAKRKSKVKPGDQSAALYDVRDHVRAPRSKRPIQTVDEVFPDYIESLEHEAGECRKLSRVELEARADAATTELVRRRGHG